MVVLIVAVFVEAAFDVAVFVVAAFVKVYMFVAALVCLYLVVAVCVSGCSGVAAFVCSCIGVAVFGVAAFDWGALVCGCSDCVCTVVVVFCVTPSFFYIYISSFPRLYRFIFIYISSVYPLSCHVFFITSPFPFIFIIFTPCILYILSMLHP